ncbi:glycine betaine/proline transport system substrate-binding protein [Saccharomonospora amisosensis]|uniref:Glycine betaine/proline transport system substrate-binding protein n=1 Tax=Saccharomonospora amisosensis TaxID=1128677 RepID=A0A7X5ZQP0_9PSEU|nr:glycine betaine ABC transporter substrate-binding protein [Saccharomonospora amisosensis]NIJ11982.1 glycine betaine/proline transport system substrate-binding protein [Saccharomonospora amisosensis]
MRVSKFGRSARLIAGLAAGALLLAACGGGDGGDGDQQAGQGGEGSLQGQDITIGVFNGWEEGIAASYLWGHILEQEGANVSYETADPGPIYAGVAQGQFDVSFDAWLPATHEDYWKEHGEDLEDLGVWYDNAPLTIAVNEDAPIQSLDELAGAADQFGGKIVGIEPGAGLTKITKEQVIPQYGLENMKLVESSTPAMLAELQGAIDRGENVVVTLWRPHWAYDAFPIRDLKDPKNALGDPEEIHSFARPGFSEDLPQAAEWIGNFKMTDEQLSSLEKIMFFENKGEKNAESVEQWLKDNPDFIDSLKAGKL